MVASLTNNMQVIVQVLHSFSSGDNYAKRYEWRLWKEEICTKLGDGVTCQCPFGANFAPFDVTFPDLKRSGHSPCFASSDSEQTCQAFHQSQVEKHGNDYYECEWSPFLHVPSSSSSDAAFSAQTIAASSSPETSGQTTSSIPLDFNDISARNPTLAELLEMPRYHEKYPKLKQQDELYMKKKLTPLILEQIVNNTPECELKTTLSSFGQCVATSGRATNLPFYRGFKYVCYAYSWIPMFLIVVIMIKFLFHRATSQLSNGMFLGLIVGTNEIFFKPLFRQSRPEESCAAHFGMPSSHAAFSAGYFFLTLLESVYRVHTHPFWKNHMVNSHQSFWHLAKQNLHFVFLECKRTMSLNQDQLNHNQALFWVCIIGLCMLPIIPCRINIRDHTSTQVIAGGAIGCLVAGVWFYSYRALMYKYNYLIGKSIKIGGENGCIVLKHDMAIPYFLFNQIVSTLRAGNDLEKYTAKEHRQLILQMLYYLDLRINHLENPRAGGFIGEADHLYFTKEIRLLKKDLEVHLAYFKECIDSAKKEALASDLDDLESGYNALSRALDENDPDAKGNYSHKVVQGSKASASKSSKTSSSSSSDQDPAGSTDASPSNQVTIELEEDLGNPCTKEAGIKRNGKPFSSYG